MGDRFFDLTRNTLGKLLWTGHILKSDVLPKAGPAIFVANHNGSAGPVAVLSSFPIRLHTWVISETVSLRKSAAYLRKDFIERDLRLKPPFSQILSWLLSLVVVPLLRGMNIVVVYRNSRKIELTFSRSLELLRKGRSLLIFPEDPATPERDGIRTFQDGFVGLGKKYYDETGQILKFYPLTVSASRRIVEAGAPVPYRPSQKPETEQRRIIRLLEHHIRSRFLTLQRSDRRR